MRLSFKSFCRNARGGVAIEFAVIGPAIVILLIAATDFGLGFYRRMQTQSAAQRGAIHATTANGFIASEVSTVITGARGSISAIPAPYTFCGCPTSSGVASISCGSTCIIGTTNVKAGTYVNASAQTTYATIFRYPGLTSPMTFSATQVVRIQ